MLQSTRRRTLPAASASASASTSSGGGIATNGTSSHHGSIHGYGAAHTSSAPAGTAANNHNTGSMNGTNGTHPSCAPRSGNLSLPGRVSVRDNRSSTCTTDTTQPNFNAGNACNGATMPTLQRRGKRRAKLRTRRRLAALTNLFGVNFYDARHSQAVRIIVICLILTSLGFVGILISVVRSGVSSTITSGSSGTSRIGGETMHNGGNAGQVQPVAGGEMHHQHHHHHPRRHKDHHRVETDVFKDLNDNPADNNNNNIDNAADRHLHDGAGDGEDDDAATTNDANEAHDAHDAKANSEHKAEPSGVTADATTTNVKPRPKPALQVDPIQKDDQETAKQITHGIEEKNNNIYDAQRLGKKPAFKAHFEGAPPCTDIEPDDISYTLVTQLSTDRMWMMRQHCRRWGLNAPISIVVYTNQTAEDITDALVADGCHQEQLAVQTLSTEDYAETEYPVNTMRNMALSAVKTTHVMYVDVDFWEAERLREVLEMDSVRMELAKDHKLAAVVPAFQILRQCKEYRDCRDENIAKMPKTTQQMMDLVTAAQAGAFDPTNRGGHGSTSYGAWYLQKEGEMYDIPCFKSNRYEPYLAFRYCEELPPFQEQFTGYGKNKLTWVMQLRQMGWDFSQLGQVFLVHYPHLDSKSRLEWNQGPKKIQEPVKLKDGTVRRREPKEVEDVDWDQYQRGQVDQLYVDFRDWLNNDTPDEARVHPCKDAVDDDSMLWIKKD